MSGQLLLLLWSVTLFAGYIVVQSGLYSAHYGPKFGATARDNAPPPGPHVARAQRALRNLLETYPVFAVLSLVVELTQQADGLSFWGAQLYFWSRWVYLPLYVFGVPYLRSAVWCLSALGLVLMFIAVVF